MEGLVGKIVWAVVVGVIVGLACLLLGMVLASLKVPPAVTIGGFLEQWCWVIGVLAGLATYFGYGPSKRV